MRDGRLSWPCWLTDSGRLNHKVVTRPASSLAQDGESSPVETSVLTTMLRRQLHIGYEHLFRRYSTLPFQGCGTPASLPPKKGPPACAQTLRVRAIKFGAVAVACFWAFAMFCLKGAGFQRPPQKKIGPPIICPNGFT